MIGSLDGPLHAEKEARSATHPHGQAPELTDLCKALAETEDYDLAEAVAHGIDGPLTGPYALGAVIEVLTAAQDHRRAVSYASRANQIAQSFHDKQSQQPGPLINVVSPFSISRGR
jgi:hypothetical protein